MKPLILITNDDGIRSEGIQALARELKRVGRVVIVAPDRERNACARSLTLNQPLHVSEIAPDQYEVDGTPADCVNIAFYGILRERPRLLVSGINHGGNLSDDILYSGTVAGAMEGTYLGIPSFAISLVSTRPRRFSPAGKFAERLARAILADGFPPDLMLNVNIPDVPAGSLKEALITIQGRKRYEGSVVERVNPRGKKYYWIGGDRFHYDEVPGADYEAISNNHISITPLGLDLTVQSALERFQDWKF